uniref:Protein tyrosine phosphatase receptor type Nb n=1 Tax=Astyanax mexicanus TaxID=7994 RepID=A0A8B9HMV8_ASTMX
IPSDLCYNEQKCTLFGQCLGPQQDRFRYRVNASLLDRLQSLLQMLMKEDQLNPKLQHYMDYMIVDTPQSSLRMQSMEPYRPTYQKYGYQDEEERSLNLVEGRDRYPASSSRSRGPAPRPQPPDKDAQLLQDLFSLLLSSPEQPTSRHRVATPLSSSSFFQGLDFPLDYSKDYVSQDVEVNSQQEQKKTPEQYSRMKITEGKMTHLVEKPPVAAVSSSSTGSKMSLKNNDISEGASVPGPLSPLKQEKGWSGEEKVWKGVSNTKNEALPVAKRMQEGTQWVFLTFVGVACVGGLLVGSLTIACLRSHARQLASGKLGLGPEAGSDTHYAYQDLCRQHMAAKSSSGKQEGVAGATGAAGAGGASGGGAGTDTSRVSSASSQFSDAAQPSPSSHSSTPSWCEEPAQSNMDISTGHMILAYMEDHVKNKDRLMKEWEALCSYQAEPSTVSVAQSESNLKKNRCPDAVPYDHSRVKLKAEINPSRTDYINASTIIEHDPRMPAYIATQGPLSHTISDFWQMVWENGCTVIVMMTALVEDGEKQCDRYWPDEGSSLYHIYEVNLVSEHIWCNDFLVRSFYLKNVQTQETRTLTQFHFLSWPAQGIPTSTRPLLDFRRKVNKCYRGRSCPIIVHCSDGTGRTGTYILIDMVLNRMAKGVKEIDIAATLEHIRDQRPGMVRTKDQFEFALTAVAEEVNAILKALPQ